MFNVWGTIININNSSEASKGGESFVIWLELGCLTHVYISLVGWFCDSDASIWFQVYFSSLSTQFVANEKEK